MQSSRGPLAKSYQIVVLLMEQILQALQKRRPDDRPELAWHPRTPKINVGCVGPRSWAISSGRKAPQLGHFFRSEPPRSHIDVLRATLILGVRGATLMDSWGFELLGHLQTCAALILGAQGGHTDG